MNNKNDKGEIQNNFTPEIEGVDYCHFDDVPFIHLQYSRKTLWFEHEHFRGIQNY